VPRSVRARAREIERVHGKLEHRLHRTPTDEEMARELGITVEEFQESLMKISNSTVVALDELWAVSDSSGDQVSLLDTLHDPDAPDPQSCSTPPSSRTAWPTRSPRCPSGRSS
jgi:RNA polymerase sigma factor for flagellar operon FliA